MIGNATAWLFRTINSKIITTRSRLMHKVLKVTLLISSKVSVATRYGRNEEVVIRNFDGDLLLTINRSRTMGRVIYWTGFHEVKELIFLHRFLKPEMTFFDIGANQGEYTLFAAKRVTRGHVFSFEPLPAMQKVLASNIQLNGFKNVSVLAYGLSDTKGVLPIFEVKDRHEGLATFYPGERESDGKYFVDLNVLDDEFRDRALTRMDFIKIDIEGGELPALKGAQKLIRKFRPVVMVEINEATYRMAGYTPTAVLDFFSALDYVPSRLDKNADLQPCAALPSFGNIIFRPR
jgi:FkbM family methyltransferase